VNRRRLLVVDDHPDMCDLVREIAEDAGFEVVATTDAGTFQDLFDGAFDVVVLDLVMPGVDGIELLRVLEEKAFVGKVVLMSGFDKRVLDTAKELARAHGLQVAGVLMKPFRITDLQDILNKPSTGELPPRAGAQADRKPRLSEAQLGEAIREGRLLLHFQPQVDLIEQKLYGAEALVRWQDPEMGMIFPDQFIPLAEETGLIQPLTDRVLRLALEQAAAWKREGLDLSVSVNIPVMLLGDLSLPNQVQDLLGELQVPPNRLMLEVTETGLVRELKESLDVLTRLRMKGVMLAVDDFGTGYSSLEQVGKVPATELKIDKSFVMNMLESDSSRAIVNSVIEMGRRLNMRVIAEGIETEDIMKALVDAGCRYGQGYLISRPLAPDRFLEWCRTAGWTAS